MTTQRPVPSDEIPENFNLSPQQKQQRPPPIQYLLNFGIHVTSGIIPSGQEHFLDQTQIEGNFDRYTGLPLNGFYPSPANQNGEFAGTELLKTYPPWWFTQHPSGYPPQLRQILKILKENNILQFDELKSDFSDVVKCVKFSLVENTSKVGEIELCVTGWLLQQGFNSFNSYIHYYPKSDVDDKLKDYAIFIPYISDYEIAEPYDPYGL